MSAGHGLPQTMPKDSPEYRAWYEQLRAGQLTGPRPSFAPRDCDRSRGGCGQLFLPRVGNQKRCDACIAASKAQKGER
jgi:hypothetical protein